MSSMSSIIDVGDLTDEQLGELLHSIAVNGELPEWHPEHPSNKKTDTTAEDYDRAMGVIR